MKRCWFWGNPFSSPCLSTNFFITAYHLLSAVIGINFIVCNPIPNAINTPLEPKLWFFRDHVDLFNWWYKDLNSLTVFLFSDSYLFYLIEVNHAQKRINSRSLYWFWKMSKDDRTMTILENINRISQFESGYAQIQFQLNRAIQSGLESSRNNRSVIHE